MPAVIAPISHIATMSHPSRSNNPYAYVKGSELATRSLIADEFPSSVASASSHDHQEAHGRPILHRVPTDNYERALAAQQEEERRGDKQLEHPGKRELKDGEEGEKGEEKSERGERPEFGRQKSWKHDDMKRMHHERLLGDEPTSPGYHTTGH